MCDCFVFILVDQLSRNNNATTEDCSIHAVLIYLFNSDGYGTQSLAQTRQMLYN
jgi:hypothetical protein